MTSKTKISQPKSTNKISCCKFNIIHIASFLENKTDTPEEETSIDNRVEKEQIFEKTPEIIDEASQETFSQTKTGDTRIPDNQLGLDPEKNYDEKYEEEIERKLKNIHQHTNR